MSQHPDEDLSPVWSPDGRRLYWLSRRHNRSLDIWAVYRTKEDHERSPEQWIALFEEEGKAGKADSKTNTGNKPVKPVRIDLASIHERARQLTFFAGDEGKFVVASDFPPQILSGISPWAFWGWRWSLRQMGGEEWCGRSFEKGGRGFACAVAWGSQPVTVIKNPGAWMPRGKGRGGKVAAKA
ncbi:MAG: hypothetical protein ACUVRY_06990 [Thermoanaerobaculaceae bacterium]